jgi:acetyl esterase/lipase
MNPARTYLGPKQYHKLKRHPYASPLFADNYEHLTPILVLSGGSETMTDEIRSFVEKLDQCNHTVFRHEEYEVRSQPVYLFKSYLL